MQANLEDETDLTFHPTVRSSFATHAETIESNNNSDENEEHDEDEDENEEDEGDFTFACAVDDDVSSSTAEEIFHNGKIKPVFPLFDQSLIDHQALVGFPHQLPPVKNVFVGAGSSQGGDEDEAAGPYCAWSKKEAAESDPAAATVCKKSNSTGFSKLWRFKEMSSRSNSDGRDTFVFLNNQSQAPNRKAPNRKAPESVTVASSNTTAKATKTKGGGKGKANVSSSISAHELYTKSKTASREEDRRKSYLPYKPELVGFFTNVNGGMSKNVHPF